MESILKKGGNVDYFFMKGEIGNVIFSVKSLVSSRMLLYIRRVCFGALYWPISGTDKKQSLYCNYTIKTHEIIQQIGR